MITREQFYKSKEWERFRKIIIDERTNEDGFVICALCGKPILKKYDLIVHHKKELDDVNVNDTNVSLNPDNVECVHFKCHNQIHERFGYNKTSSYKPMQKKVYIVYGAPCAGKTTWVHENATENDLIIDIDSIWEMLSINARYTKPNALKSAVFETRDKLYDIVKHRAGNWHSAYIITGSPLPMERERLKNRVGATDTIFVNTDKITCLDRAEIRDNLTTNQREQLRGYIAEWFDKFQPD